MSSNNWRRRAGASRAATFTRALRARRAGTARVVTARAAGSDEIKSGNDCAPISGTHDATTKRTTPSTQRHRVKTIDLHLATLKGLRLGSAACAPQPFQIPELVKSITYREGPGARCRNYIK